MKDSDILHETAHLHAIRSKAGVEIRLNASTCSFPIGSKPDLASAQKTMGKLERYPQNLPLLIAPELRYQVRI
jgi:hypothetical protein